MIARSVAARRLLLFAMLVASPGMAAAETKRLVVIKADGLAQEIVEQMVRERNPRTGQSVLPWIERLFFKNGTRISNFYVRGMSLSGPSWSMLDTGQHLSIKGNVEFDRYTQHSYDYLNFFPFWLGAVAGRYNDMWGTAVLDDQKIPLLLDAYPYDERYQSFQLFQRGKRLATISEGLQKRFTTRSARDLVDEWFLGFDIRGLLTEQLERELIETLDDPRARYLDFYTTDFDHAAHHNKDHATHRAALQELDAIIGRIWTAISRTPQAPETTLVLVADHGVNSDERFYSQGFNLVHLLAGQAGGGHHVVTKRRLMKDYSIKGIYPLVPLITTTSADSPYLKGKSDDYPTALVDFDGNERASIHLRDAALNVLQILFGQLQRPDLSPQMRRAATDAFLRVVDRHRLQWQRTLAELPEEVAALQRASEALRAIIPPPPERKTGKSKTDKTQPLLGETSEQLNERIRKTARLEAWTTDVAEYTAYLATLERLLGATPATLAPGAVRAEDLFAPRAMGERNTLHDLANYVVGTGPSGLVLAPDGSLDFDRSFARVDYFALLTSARVRNNVQRGVTNAPVDFTAVRIDCRALASSSDAAQADTCVWLDAGEEAQAIVLGRIGGDGGLLLKYLPVSRLAEDAHGVIHFSPVGWRAGLPLKFWEDERLAAPGGDRAAWLDGWHGELEWLRATHRTLYSNAIIGLHEHFRRFDLPAADPAAGDEGLIRRLRARQRAIVEPDLVVLANNHWNFDVRGFNPGGNHGSFFRISTHSTLMLAGGERTGIPQGLDVQEPYDSLSFVPTMFALTGQLDEKGLPGPALRERGFQPFPGRVIREVLPAGEAPPRLPAVEPVKPASAARSF